MQTDPTTGMPVDRKKVSAVDFYAYRIMMRTGAVNHILRCRQLFHQFIVDMYTKIESERLWFIRLNQKKLRVDEYIHLRDAIANDGNTDNLDQLVILPSTFTRSPRHMHEYTQDAMTYVKNYGRPDLFVTFTRNATWEQIQEELLDGQNPFDRHDLLARVFRQKLIKLMNIITKSHVFRRTRCWMYSIEWQKRGLPHAHILIWLKDKIKPDEIDSVISAALPDRQQDPRLFQIIVKKHDSWAFRKVFKRRVQGTTVPGYPNIRATNALDRVYTVHPNNFECFFLRLLLHTIRGPTSFEALGTVNGRICATFREACQLIDLLEDDAQWDATITEAATIQSPARLRNLFVIILLACGPSNPEKLWESYKEGLTEDILIQARRENPGLVLNYTPDMFNQTLIILEDKALAMAGKDLKQLGLPTPQTTLGDRLTREILRETSYDLNDLNKYISRNEPLLLPNQRAAHNAILDRINRNVGEIIFLDAPGGTGKTFVINLLLAKIRQQSKIAIAVASSGIAATLLHGGRTAHSTLKLPLNLTQCEASLDNISKGTGEAKVLQECKLIVWDECTMAHKQALEARDRTLQYLRGNGKLMGGAVLLLAGDFRQTLPVIPKGTMADELKACWKASYLCRHVHKLELKTNMRVHLQGDAAAGQYAQQLLSLGDGKIAADPTTGLITIPNNFCNIVDSIETFKTSVFPDIRRCFNDHKWLCERAILAPKNDSVNDINLQIQQQLPGVDVSYKSIDTVVDIDQAVQYPIEFLNSLEPPGMPPHSLVFKVVSPIMLLRNLHSSKLSNGTRFCVKNLMLHVIEATI
ncbi:unnamed protein product [Rotaria magnacalcarata]|uniref:ATP-dependent DNA helicase n=1 Tax=Rotaria magnacalcarata TaxID=392030 RepID=A0A816BA43_9BILA|nr:unnamed protein product [Rotaria magnacalcarata]CAF1651240.1 unnamed protein product [Rotaria magnacalcarata]